MRKPAEREWSIRKHGAQGRRQGRKGHLAMDAATSDIRAVEFTPCRDGDSPFVGKTVHRTVSLSSSLPERLDQIPGDEEIGIVTGDDTRRGHTAIIERRATALVGRVSAGRNLPKSAG